MTLTVVVLAYEWNQHLHEVSAFMGSAAAAYAWWTRDATPEARAIWEMILATLAILTVIFVWFVRRFYYRLLFPDLYRLDVHAHFGGKPERIGRLYRVRAFKEDEQTRYRLWFKHDARGLFPLLRFDTVDVDEAPRARLFGQVEVRAGRFDRAPERGMFARIAATQRHGTAPLLPDFREEDFREDRLRKEGIVLPGARTSPDVVRRKFAQEPMMTPDLVRAERRLRRANLTNTTTSDDEAPRGASPSQASPPEREGAS